MGEDAAAISESLMRFFENMRSRIGERRRRHLGIIGEVQIRRYALAIGERDPIHHDEAAAKAAGFAGLVAPPNLLAGVAEWGAGLPEDELTPDGTVRLEGTGDLRVMGAGEEMELLQPVVAGADVYDDEVIESVDLKQGRSGAIVFVTTLHEFVDADGTVLNRNRRTILARA